MTVFFATFISNDISESSNLQQVLMTIIHGAVEVPDPTGQKSCFSILKKLIEVWGKIAIHVFENENFCTITVCTC